MKIDKSLISGSTTMLILKLLEKKDMYGYEMIEVLKNRSDETFLLKAGTLYPLLHGLENKGVVHSFTAMSENGRERKYYQITKNGNKLLEDKEKEWVLFSSKINSILHGGAFYETI